jgi:C1A family cysteine protease
MSKTSIFILALVCISTVFSQDVSTSVHTQILGKFLNGNPKELFKVWHFIFNKEYDYNTEEGLSKYKTFKENLKEIKAINSNPSNTWKAGLNEHSDKSFEEFSNYYNIKPIDVAQIKTSVDILNKNKGFRLDDYNEDDDESTMKNVKAGTLYDYRSNSLPIRNQLSCGSCWAFATMAQLENSYWAKYKSTAGAVNQYLSVQQLVDCDTTSYGCRAGFPNEAMMYLQKSYPMPDSKYTYTATAGTCKFNSASTTGVRVSGVRYGGTYYYPWYNSYVKDLLANGPVVVLIGVNSAFNLYSSGIFNSPCASGVNHSVLVVGYGYDSTTGVYYYIVRNSWGSTWGEVGYIRIKDDGVACSIPIYGYQGIVA